LLHRRFGKKRRVFFNGTIKLDRQKMSIEEMQSEIDTLKRTIDRAQRKMFSGRQFAQDPSPTGMLSAKKPLEIGIARKKIRFAGSPCMNRNPSDPEQVRQGSTRSCCFKENASRPSKNCSSIKTQTVTCVLLGISLIGDIGGSGASRPFL